MDSFVGREREIATLDRHLQRVRAGGGDQRGRALLLRGRRRVGKSRLVEAFCEQARVPAVFFTATQGEDASRQRAEFVRVVAEESDLPERERFGDLAPGTWDAAFRQLAALLPAEQSSIVVLDELPFLAAADPAMEGALQTAWDRYLSRKPVFLIAIGSDLSMMEALSEYGRPFHQRAAEMVLGPLTPREVSRMLALDAAEAIDAYLVTGGLPLVCREWLRGWTVESFLRHSFDDPTAALLVSAERTLTAELPVEGHTRRILSVIGGLGERTFTRIAQRTGTAEHPLPPASLNDALRLLQEKRLVAVDTPLSTKGAPRDKRYRVADPYLRFWLAFCQDAMRLVDRGRGDLALAQWKQRWNSWRGRAVEPLIREALSRLLPDSTWPDVREVGGWWPRTNRPELDLVGADDAPVARKVGFVGSIKWHERSPFGDHDLRRLAQDALAVPGVTAATRLVAVSRCGVTAHGLSEVWHPDDLLEAW